MQLMALNALLLFDAIFIFFLFLVSVSCLLYYLPLVPPTRSSRLLMASMAAADLESALAQGGVEAGADGLGHDETGTDGEHLEHHHHHHQHQHLLHHHQHDLLMDDDIDRYTSSNNLLQQTTVIITDPTTHIVAPEHQARAKHHNKNDPPIECV